MNFNQTEIELITNHGLTVEKIERDLYTFKQGIPFVHLISAATLGNGIEVFSEKQKQELIAVFEEEKDSRVIIKFVPASGAATRMFQFLYEFVNNYNPDTEKLSSFFKRKPSNQTRQFLKGCPQLPFARILRAKIKSLYPDYKYYTIGKRTHLLIKTLLDKDGLNYSNTPKGLIPFHSYSKYYSTAFEEQLLEAGFYAAVNGQCFVHFTFSEDHLQAFKEEFERVKSRLERKTKCNFTISYSFQKKETDTLAVNLENLPYKDVNENLCFRPAGHGALIENLNDIDADIIFIKNIDNVVVEEDVELVAYHKKILAGHLLHLQKQIFRFMEKLDERLNPENLKSEITTFLQRDLHIKKLPVSLEEMRKILDRPIRVCGMVANTGAPGGGPFWVQTLTGDIALQIVELSQVDPQNTQQMSLVAEATHFNPVDIVCGIKDYKGNKFKLSDFVNKKGGFISQKSINGDPVKALELPGLWNGAMAHWNTIFVEVPLSTFNPVKTVNDLLDESHQTKKCT